MPHRNAVVHGNGVEFLGNAAGLLDFPADQLPQILEVYMAGNELSKGIGNGDDGFAKVFILHAGGAPKSTCASHIAACGRCPRTILGHGCLVSLL